MLVSTSRHSSRVSIFACIHCMLAVGRALGPTRPRKIKQLYILASSAPSVGIVLRSVKEGQSIEKLMGFEACKKVCGIDIFNTVKKFLQDRGEYMKVCRGQGYDGAAAISGAFNGRQAHFIREVPQATYYHCSSHQLNLALSKACTVDEIHRMVDSLNPLSAKPSFQLWYPGGQRLKVISFS